MSVVGSAEDILKVHEEIWTDGEVNYVIRGCGSVMHYNSGRRVAIMCTTGAVARARGGSDAVSTAYVQLTMCCGPVGMVADLPIKVDDTGSTFAFTWTEVEASVVAVTAMFRSEMGNRLPMSFPLFADPQPIQRAAVVPNRILAVGAGSSLKVQVDGSTITASAKGACYSPPGKFSLL